MSYLLERAKPCDVFKWTQCYSMPFLCDRLSFVFPQIHLAITCWTSTMVNMNELDRHRTCLHDVHSLLEKTDKETMMITAPRVTVTRLYQGRQRHNLTRFDEYEVFPGETQEQSTNRSVTVRRVGSILGRGHIYKTWGVRRAFSWWPSSKESACNVGDTS